MESRFFPGGLLCLVMGTTAGFASSAFAAEFNVDAAVSGRIEYNDNASLRFARTPSWRYLFDPSFTASRRTESSQVSARLRLGFNRYSNSAVPDTTDKVATLAATRTLERSKLGVSVNYSELSSQSLQVLGQTGINVGRQQVTTLDVTPTWTYSLSPLLSLNASTGYTTTKFEQTTSTEVTDYTTSTASTGFTRLLGDRGSAGLSVSYLKFDTSPFVSSSESWSGNASLTYDFSPTLTGSATVGFQRVLTKQTQVVRICPIDPIFCRLGLVATIQFGFVGESTQRIVPFNLNLQWRMSERDTVSATFLQRVNASGVGALTSGYQVSGNFTHAISPVSDFVLTANYVRSRALGGSTIGDVLSFSPTLNWRLSEAWTFGSGYVHTRLTYPDLARDVEAHAVFVSLTYGWPQWNVRH